MPTIMRPRPRLRARASSISARIRAHARLEPDEDRLADQEMADVELGKLRDRGDRLHRRRR